MFNITIYILFTLFTINIMFVYYILNNKIQLLESTLNKQSIVLTNLLRDCATFITEPENSSDDQDKKEEVEPAVDDEQDVESDVETDVETDVESDVETDVETDVEELIVNNPVDDNVIDVSDDEADEVQVEQVQSDEVQVDEVQADETQSDEVQADETQSDEVQVDEVPPLNNVQIVNLSDIKDIKQFDISKLEGEFNDVMSEDNVSYITTNEEGKDIKDVTKEDLLKMKVNDLKNIAIFNKLIDKSKIRKMRKQEVLELLFKSL